jgi:3-deoxy-manno-octulosonate cytidylyltransferase (CMP-KDO synthetase)
MRILGVIPARYSSTRFPGKPLVIIEGKTMIQRVYEQAKKCHLLETVYVATDNQAIFNHVADFGGKVMMTAAHHRSGTERCQEVVSLLAIDGSSFDAVVNIQGDEPFIDPAQVGQVAECFTEGNADIATLIKRILSVEVLNDPNVVKVVVGANGNALYFSRSAIPFTRGEKQLDWLSKTTYYRHIGIYGYSIRALAKIVMLPPSALETAESLEQLRWLENGLTISTKPTDYESIGIDTPSDLLKITNRTSGFSR